MGRLLGQRLRKTGQTALTRTRKEALRSAHNKTGSTHNKSVARAMETIVRMARNQWLHAPRRRRRLLPSRLYSCMWRWSRHHSSWCSRCSSCWHCCRRRIPPAHGLHGQEGYIKVPVFQQ